jgi:hypothetical protein
MGPWACTNHHTKSKVTRGIFCVERHRTLNRDKKFGIKIENFIAIDDLTKTFAIVPLSG